MTQKLSVKETLTDCVIQKTVLAETVMRGVNSYGTVCKMQAMMSTHTRPFYGHFYGTR